MLVLVLVRVLVRVLGLGLGLGLELGLVLVLVLGLVSGLELELGLGLVLGRRGLVLQVPLRSITRLLVFCCRFWSCFPHSAVLGLSVRAGFGPPSLCLVFVVLAAALWFVIFVTQVLAATGVRFLRVLRVTVVHAFIHLFRYFIDSWENKHTLYGTFIPVRRWLLPSGAEQAQADPAEPCSSR